MNNSDLRAYQGLHLLLACLYLNDVAYLLEVLVEVQYLHPSYLFGYLRHLVDLLDVVVESLCLAARLPPVSV